MKIIFRADGNLCVGAGHLMRCLSLAAAASDQGIECKFITADGSFRDKIIENGFEVVVLNTDFKHLYKELFLVEGILKREKPDYIIVDSYYVTTDYLSYLRQYGKLVYIDDVASFAYPVDILINYNIYASKMNYDEIYKQAGIPIPIQAIGINYTPLRKEFHNLPHKAHSGSVHNILVSAGGADPEGIALKIAEYLLDHISQMKNYKFHFIVSKYEPDAGKMENIASKYKWILLHKDVKKMSELMQSCEIAISAAGSTLYELCACGIPTITYILADNQIMGAETFEQTGVMLNAGDVRKKENFVEDLFLLLSVLCDNTVLRASMTEKAQRLIDGNGAVRLAEWFKNI